MLLPPPRPRFAPPLPRPFFFGMALFLMLLEAGCLYGLDGLVLAATDTKLVLVIVVVVQCLTALLSTFSTPRNIWI